MILGIESNGRVNNPTLVLRSSIPIQNLWRCSCQRPSSPSCLIYCLSFNPSSAPLRSTSKSTISREKSLTQPTSSGALQNQLPLKLIAVVVPTRTRSSGILSSSRKPTGLPPNSCRPASREPSSPMPASTLHASTPGGGERVYMRYRFSDVLVSSYSVHGSAGGESLPTEDITFSHEQIKVSYRGVRKTYLIYDENGQLVEEVSVGLSARLGGTPPAAGRASDARETLAEQDESIVNEGDTTEAKSVSK